MPTQRIFKKRASLHGLLLNCKPRMPVIVQAQEHELDLALKLQCESLCFCSLPCQSLMHTKRRHLSGVVVGMCSSVTEKRGELRESTQSVATSAAL